ncbi:glycoside hydrolase family 35 protein [Microbacterium sp. No. 7]|uniref:glycoside hydrolase family 35 protein n=1 Tax=Microbacterium sp. No. 7 TaxID=1714373 RepID=UPI0006D06F39|nr:beta-galactosidase family protein [Microbacterium sp. No. 7]ALJ21345.1 beta-galactosidase [Microbacterium sp. No. 7]
MTARSFRIGDRDFLLDGEPFRVISGALHYFRVHPDQWRDRIRMGRMMGLNTIETYVAWNEHSPERGVFDTAGRLDLARFLQEVHDEGMHAIVRPGPYICAEFDGGGLPAWLFRDGDVAIRSTDPRFLADVSAYLRDVMAIVAPLQVDRGGPVILLQVENEYGAYGDDHDYLRALAALFREYGASVPLTTVDQPEARMLEAGGIPELHKTGSFGSRAAERLDVLRAQQPTGPLMCSEFWCGWFDHWGAHHHTTEPGDSARELDALLAAGASVNVYMLHGGTNFGLTNGANHKGVYQPTVTSYDYDAPLDEAGRPTPKFWAFREVISRHAPVPAFAPAPAEPFAVPPPARLRHVGALADLLEARWSAHADVPTMDDVGIARGLARYTARLDVGADPVVLAFAGVRDRAWVSLDGTPVASLSREAHERAVTLPTGTGRLEILVEDEGRVNYGVRIGERKGLIGPATVDGVPLTGWRIAPVPIDLLPQTQAAGAPRRAGASVWRATVALSGPADLAMSTDGLGKGIAWINGFCLGRYWRKGPQASLFVPAPATRAGENEITILELETLTATEIGFADDLRLGHTES